MMPPRRLKSAQKHRRGADGIIRPSRTIFVGYMVWLMTLPMVSAAPAALHRQLTG